MRRLAKLLNGAHLFQFAAELLHSACAERHMETPAKYDGKPIRLFSQHALCDQQFGFILHGSVDLRDDIVRKFTACESFDPSVESGRRQDFVVADPRLRFKKQLLQICHGCYFSALFMCRLFQPAPVLGSGAPNCLKPRHSRRHARKAKMVA